MKQTHLEARERVLEVADRLFAERGYQPVTLRDIAQEVGIRHASLYYHFPQGKEELFVAVTAQRMQRYRAGLEHALQEAGADWQHQLYAAGEWLLSQPAMNLGRMMQSDMRMISEEASEQLRTIVYDALLQPLVTIFLNASEIKAEKRQHSTMLAGMFYSLIEGIYQLPPSYIQGSRQLLLDFVIDTLINGLKL